MIQIKCLSDIAVGVGVGNVRTWRLARDTRVGMQRLRGVISAALLWWLCAILIPFAC